MRKIFLLSALFPFLSVAQIVHKNFINSLDSIDILNIPNQIKAYEYLLIDCNEDWVYYVYYKKGMAEYYSEKHQDAIVSFTKSINSTPHGEAIFCSLTKNDIIYTITNNGFFNFEYIDNFDTIDDKSHSFKEPDRYLYRASCKQHVYDYMGGIMDLKKYHSILKDSTVSSNTLYGVVLLRMKKYKEAKNYFTVAIKNCNKFGGNEDDDDLRHCYYCRGICNELLLQKEKACLDWSKAGELGKSEAYDKIKESCNK